LSSIILDISNSNSKSKRYLCAPEQQGAFIIIKGRIIIAKFMGGKTIDWLEYHCMSSNSNW
jgi:hypothetical protein